MNLNFEIGSEDKPKGHALVFFRKKDDIEQVLATYIITLPLNVDVSKYVPPMFAPQISTSVNSVLYEFMSDADRLRELSKLIGKLRFAAEGYDPRLRREAEDEIESLSGYMPENFNIGKIAEAAGMSNSVGDNLAQLYLERCYRLREEDYRGVQKIDDEIRSIEEIL